ncbi:hypothetical protein SynPROSU1_02139 [Synechococcus sp. PROS-U-1]|nr:hypothetical protein SynPROSU1_02139 [Synechococcus sp. PROS-U-1]
MQPRGLSIDPTKPLTEQRIGTTIQMPWQWVQILGDVARNAGVSKSRLYCHIIEEWAKANDVELPPTR